jgi:hypothetical protein
VFSSSLFVVHDTSRGSQDNVTELSGWQQVVSPLLNVTNSNVKSWRDDTNLVQTTVQLDNNLTRSVVINVLELTNVTVLLDNLQELDDNLGGWSDDDLSLTGLLGVVDGVQSVSEDRGSGHIGCGVPLLNRLCVLIVWKILKNPPLPNTARVGRATASPTDFHLMS